MAFGLSAGAAMAVGVGGALLLGGGQKAPDTSGMNQAATDNAALGREQLDWMKQVYADGAGDRATASQRAIAVSDAQLAAMKTQTELTDDLASYNKKTFRPLEQRIVAEANNFDTEGKREELAGKAMGDVQQGFDAAEQQQIRQQQRMGVDPNSGRALALSSEMTAAKALGLAGAANKARSDATTLGYARKMDAVSLGRNLSSNQSTAASLALTAGNNAVGNAQVPLAVTQGGVSQMQSGYGQTIGANNSAANIYGNIGSLQNQTNAQDTNNMLAMAKIGSMAVSDKNKKTKRKKVSGKLALSMINKMPVESWKYKKGVADEGEHIGPMAQDVQKAVGDEAAPGGKMIDLVTLNGLSLAAVQHLDQRIKRLEKRAPGLADTRRQRAA